MLYRSRFFQFTATFLALTLVAEAFAPLTLYALADGPSQTEYVGGGGGSMVNPFTGEFSYSIPVLSVPGPNGAGYGLTLTYNNNTSPESEASWVGLGWSLNAGAVNRVKRGFPDDYKKSDITYWKKARVNSTIRIKRRADLEITSLDFISEDLQDLIEQGSYDPEDPDELAAVSEAFTLQYNNQTGFDWYYDLGAGLLGAEANLEFSENGVELDGDFNPLVIIGKALPKEVTSSGFWWGVNFQKFQFDNYKDYVNGLNETNPPARVPKHRGYALSFSGAVEADVLPNVGLEGGITGTYSRINSVLEDHEKAYGYLYSGDVSDDADAMDYYVEKDDHYMNSDKHLPIPFSNADVFAISGMSGGGAFRAYQRNSGHFRPPSKESRTYIGHGNLELHVGEEIGVGGVGAGGGRKKFLVRGWESNGRSFGSAVDDGERTFFRFIGDRGGSMQDVSDLPVQLSLFGGTSFSLFDETSWKTNRNTDAEVWSQVNNGKRVGRSTYIDYNTNAEVLDGPPFGCYYSDGGVHYRSYSKRSSTINSYVDRTDPALKDGIGEFSVIGSDGMTYVYGLPVYSRNELTMSYGLYGLDKVQDLENNFIAYKNVSDYRTNDNLDGVESNDPYATAFLLTEVVSPDYVDRTNNGPTPDDIGGYVVFNYNSTAGSFEKKGSTDSWYKWRTPYRGTYYSRNFLSDPYDDLGTFSSGYKEIYYLESIETKTNKAVFHTSPREDAYEAHHDESVAGADHQATTAGSSGNSKVHRLDKIELFAKGENGSTDKLLSTTQFRYDYSLCPGVPNAESSGGKLTLKRLWFEYEGAVNARISPYEFEYKYKQFAEFPNEIKNNSEYVPLISHGDALSDGSSSQQNPAYSAFNIDRWGSYQPNGASRYSRYQQWVDQTSVANEDFDPAPWQLKWIKLPSGGEIHIHYEQNDYRYVQDREAMVMVPLTEGSSGYNFELDLSAIGVGQHTTDDGPDFETMNDAEGAELANLLKKHFGDYQGAFTGDREYIYYRLLYGLINTISPDLDKCTSEYFTGYAAVTNVNYNSTTNKLTLQIGNSNDGNTLPEKKCEEFYRAVRQGIHMENCGSPHNSLSQDTENESTIISIIYEVYERIFSIIGASFTLCEDINYEESYLRIPTIMDKKGGGIRVKRILTLDPGLESEDVALDGTEYIYQDVDGRSSGVAVTEPVVGREENALVHLKTLANNSGDRDSIITGKSMRQGELPLGESLLPSASVGYSRVIARNIHTGKSSAGFVVYNYYTARDYPHDLRGMRSDLQDFPEEAEAYTADPATPMMTSHGNRFPLELIVYGNYKNTIEATQGYRFIINHMHGQSRSVKKYIGTYTPGGGNDMAGASLVEQATYEYYQPWESIPMMDGPSIDNIYQDYPGKVVEVVTESRELVDDWSDADLQVDGGLFYGFPAPFPFASFSGRYQVDKQKLRTHVTSKVVEIPVFLKSMVVTKDNIVDRTDYIGFDPESGTAILVKKYDGFNNLMLGSQQDPHDGTYYGMTIPAWREYPNFGQIARTQGTTVKSDKVANSNDGNSGVAFDKRFIRITNGSTSTDEHYLNVRTVKPGSTEEYLNSLVVGDLIELFEPESDGSGVKRRLGLYNVGTIGAGRIELLPVSYSATNNEQEIRDVWIEIVRTGRNNRTGTTVGGFSTYGTPPTYIEKPLQ